MLAACCVLAGLSQLCFLANWPLYVLEARIGFWPGTLVAIVRMGVYLGLAWGLAQRRPEAWAGTLLELIRTFFLVVTPMVQALVRHEPQPASFFPAAWAQGLLSGALPLAVLLNGAIALGWRPGALLETPLSALVKVLAAVGFSTATWLWREPAQFHLEPSERVGSLLGRGLPFVILLSLVEFTALLLSGLSATPQHRGTAAPRRPAVIARRAVDPRPGERWPVERWPAQVTRP